MITNYQKTPLELRATAKGLRLSADMLDDQAETLERDMKSSIAFKADQQAIQKTMKDLNRYLDQDMDIKPALVQTAIKNNLCLDRVTYLWFEMGKKQRAKKDTLERDRFIMKGHRAGLSDKEISTMFKSKFGKMLHPKTVNHTKLDILKDLNSLKSTPSLNL